MATKQQKRIRRHAKRVRRFPPKGGRDYRQIWRVIDGAVYDAFKHHPDYLTDKGHSSARESLDKRITAAVTSYLAEAGWGRSG